MLTTVTTQAQRKAKVAVLVPSVSEMLTALESGETILVLHADTVAELKAIGNNRNDPFTPSEIVATTNPDGDGFLLKQFALPVIVEDNCDLGYCGQPLRNCMIAEQLGIPASELAMFSGSEVDLLTNENGFRINASQF